MIKAPCPGCGTPVVVDGPAPSCAVCGHRFEIADAQVDEKKCPYCAEPIVAAAKKCKHCGEWVDPKMRRRAEQQQGQPAVQFLGDRIRCTKSYALPNDCCWICASRTGAAPQAKNFIYSPAWTYALLVAGLIGLILIIAYRKQGSVLIPLCARCRRAWGWATAGKYLTAILGIFAFPTVFGFLGYALDPNGAGVGLGILFGLVTWIVALILVEFLWVRKTQAVCSGMDDLFIDLKFPQLDRVRAAVEQGAREV